MEYGVYSPCEMCGALELGDMELTRNHDDIMTTLEFQDGLDATDVKEQS